MNTQLLKDLKGILYEAGGFTVRVKNSMLGSSKFVGTFEDQESAEEYARKEASRSRKFASFEVWTGSPKKPGKQVGDAIEGHASSKTEEKRECASCGALVPERDSPPYSDHKKTCELVKKWKSKTEELDESGSQDVIMQHLALAAQVAGVDLDDDASLKNFLVQVRDVVTKDKAQLKAKLKRWNSGKARTAIRATKSVV